MKNSCKWQLGSPATAERGEQPGNHWFKIHLGTRGWADTGKTAQAVPVPCLSLWLKQSSFQTCSTAGILQTKINPKETNNQIPHPPRKSKTEKIDRKKKSQTNPTQPKKSNYKQLKGREGNSKSCTAWRSQHFAKGKEQAIWAADSTSGKPIGKL